MGKQDRHIPAPLDFMVSWWNTGKCIDNYITDYMWDDRGSPGS